MENENARPSSGEAINRIRRKHEKPPGWLAEELIRDMKKEKSMENREEGFYWVRGESNWLVAKWRKYGLLEKWEFHGIQDPKLEKMIASEIVKVGPKIEPPITKHECSFNLVRNAKIYGDFYYCSCGAIMSPATQRMTHKQMIEIRKILNTPGAVFEIVEGEP